MEPSTLSNKLHNENVSSMFARGIFHRKVVLDVICFLYILLFVYASTSKLLDYQKFAVEIGKSPLLTNYVTIIPWLLPALEILVSLMLAVPRVRMQGLYASFSLMTLFTFYIVEIIYFGVGEVPCSCGGVLQNMGWEQHLIFNILFSLLALLAIFLHDPYSDKASRLGT